MESTSPAGHIGDANGPEDGLSIFNVFGGTVTTPTEESAGLRIGGGSTGYTGNYGRVNMYGGLISVPKITLCYGDIALYGGTLECTGGEVNFIFSQERPENRINISGGTLKLDSDSVTTMNTLIASGRIYSARGTLGEPVVLDGYTTLTSSDNNMIRAWNPSPANNARNVHYKDTNSVTLSWNKGDYDYNVVDGREVNVIHKVYFGTSLAKVTAATEVNAEYKGTRYDANNDPCNWTIAGPFTIGGKYYWRIDEVNTVSNACAKGLVWKFYVHDGKAYNPKPADKQYGLSEPLTLSWTAGDWAKTHQVYVGTERGDGQRRLHRHH